MLVPLRLFVFKGPTFGVCLVALAQRLRELLRSRSARRPPGSTGHHPTTEEEKSGFDFWKERAHFAFYGKKDGSQTQGGGDCIFVGGGGNRISHCERGPGVYISKPKLSKKVKFEVVSPQMSCGIIFRLCKNGW